MTHEEWLGLRVGDVVIDHRANGSPWREVREVIVVPLHGKGGSKRPERVVITVDSLRDPSRRVAVFEADDWMDGVGKRLELAREP